MAAGSFVCLVPAFFAGFRPRAIDESHKKALVKSEVPMWGALLTMVILLIAFFALYELLVWVVDKALRALDRRRHAGDVIGS